VETPGLFHDTARHVAMVVAGKKPAAACDHLLYVTIDVLRLCILAAVIWEQTGRVMSAFG
jgi:hypothetical protein